MKNFYTSITNPLFAHT